MKIMQSIFYISLLTTIVLISFRYMEHREKVDNKRKELKKQIDQLKRERRLAKIKSPNITSPNSNSLGNNLRTLLTLSNSLAGSSKMLNNYMLGGGGGANYASLLSNLLQNSAYINDPQTAQLMQLTQKIITSGLNSSNLLSGAGGGSYYNQFKKKRGKKRVGGPKIIDIKSKDPEKIMAKIKTPRIKGHYLGWCLKKDRACGAPAAHAWCRSQQYQKALKWQKGVKFPAKDVYIMGDRKISLEDSYIFKFVVCTD